MSRQPEIAEIIRHAVETGLSRVRVSLPAIVQSYNASEQTATVELGIEDDIGRTILSDVRVKFEGGGGYRILYPISAGDEVSVIFESADTSEFQVTGSVSRAPLGAIGYSCYAVPGGVSDGKAHPDAPTDKMVLGKADASTQIEIDDEIRLDAGATSYVALADKTDQVLSALKAFAAATASGDALTTLPAASTAMQTVLSALTDTAATKVKAT